MGAGGFHGSVVSLKVDFPCFGGSVNRERHTYYGPREEHLALWYRGHLSENQENLPNVWQSLPTNLEGLAFLWCALT